LPTGWWGGSDPRQRATVIPGSRFARPGMTNGEISRHCEERSDEAIHSSFCGLMDCFASLAMTNSGKRSDRTTASPDRSTDLPDGQITDLAVQPLLQKYFGSRLTQIRCISKLSRPTEGRIARRHERGAGCGGRESVRRALAIAGRDEPRERFAACKMIGALADGKAVWSRHPLLVPSWRRRNQVRPGLMSS